MTWGEPKLPHILIYLGLLEIFNMFSPVFTMLWSLNDVLPDITVQRDYQLMAWTARSLFILKEVLNLDYNLLCSLPTFLPSNSRIIIPFLFCSYIFNEPLYISQIFHMDQRLNTKQEPIFRRSTNWGQKHLYMEVKFSSRWIV